MGYLQTYYHKSRYPSTWWVVHDSSKILESSTRESLDPLDGGTIGLRLTPKTGIRTMAVQGYEIQGTG